MVERSSISVVGCLSRVASNLLLYIQRWPMLKGRAVAVSNNDQVTSNKPVR